MMRTGAVWGLVFGLLPYPFLPGHLTIIDSLAIGVPSFFLALAPNGVADGETGPSGVLADPNCAVCGSAGRAP